jgi:F-type H+-transporting ATPase subunit epsilon|tara:strand:- start:4407 stop:4814 length:408 start_codon:yes stop_codon:yes gene_type:complete
MTEEKLNLEVVSPEKLIMSKSVDMVTVSGTEGDFGVLPGHTALVSSIRPGLLQIEADKDVEIFFISGGFIEVIEDKVSILATDVISPNDINISECEDKIKKYNENIEASENEVDTKSFLKSIAKYQAMIDFKNIN